MEDNINILDELKQLDSDILIHTERSNPYFLPEGFFNNLSSNITSQIWLNSVPNRNPYFAPTGYFENLSEIILDKVLIKSNEITGSQNLYSVPDGYFNSLADNILGKLKDRNQSVQQELEEVAPLLSKIPKVNVYTVPSGYFESLTSELPAYEIQPAKIIPIKRIKPRRWIAYAAAACIAALMFGGGYYYMQDDNVNSSSSKHSTTQSQIADIKVEQAISQLSDAEIQSYLSNDNTDVYIPQNDSQDINIQTLLKNMSDEEINNYLRENSEPGDNTKGI